MDKLVKAVMDNGHSAVHIVQRDYLFDWMVHNANDIRMMAPMMIVDSDNKVVALLVSDLYHFVMISASYLDIYIIKSNQTAYGDNVRNDFIDTMPFLNNIESDVTIRQLYDFIVNNLP
jgi:hypothetical protein